MFDVYVIHLPVFIKDALLCQMKQYIP